MIAEEILLENYGVEMTLVVIACRVHFKTAGKEELYDFIQRHDINWGQVLTICRKHSIRPLVYPVIAGAVIPKEIAEKIQIEFMRITRRNVLQSKETERIITLLGQNGITVIPYKGTAFSMQWYGNINFRECSDIDFIIQPTDLKKIIHLMQKDGYIPEASMEFDYLGNKFFKYYKEFNFNKKVDLQTSFHVEFQWSIAEDQLRVRNASKHLLNHTESKLYLVNREVNALNRDAHYMAILLHHSVKDVFRSLKLVIDLSQASCIHQTMKAPEWEFIQVQAKQIGLDKALSMSSYLGSALFGVLLYDNKYPLNSKDKKHFLDQCLTDNVLKGNEITNRKLFVSRILLRDNWLEKLKFIHGFIVYRFIPTVVDFRIMRLPHGLFFLYHFWKPFRSLIRPTNPEEERKRIFQN